MEGQSKTESSLPWELLAPGSVTAFSCQVGLLAFETKVRMDLKVCICREDLCCHKHFISVNIRTRNQWKENWRVNFDS